MGSRRQRHAGNQWHIRGLVAAVGEIDAGRGLGRAADANEKNVGVVEILRQVAVIVQHSEVERLDAPEVVGIEHVLAGDRGRRRRAEVGFEHLEDALERRDARNVEALAGLFDNLWSCDTLGAPGRQAPDKKPGKRGLL